MIDPISLDRLLGRLPPQSHKRDLICTAMSAHGERWIVLWDAGQSLDALQAAVDWAMNPELSFDLTDAVWVNDAISTAMCEGQ